MKNGMCAVTPGTDELHDLVAIGVASAAAVALAVPTSPVLTAVTLPIALMCAARGFYEAFVDEPVVTIAEDTEASEADRYRCRARLPDIKRASDRFLHLQEGRHGAAWTLLTAAISPALALPAALLLLLTAATRLRERTVADRLMASIPGSDG